MFIQVDDYLLANDLAKVGDKVVVISGSPPGIIGSTNDIRIHKVGEVLSVPTRRRPGPPSERAGPSATHSSTGRWPGTAPGRRMSG